MSCNIPSWNQSSPVSGWSIVKSASSPSVFTSRSCDDVNERNPAKTIFFPSTNTRPASVRNFLRASVKICAASARP